MATCTCECGEERIVQMDNLKNGHTLSCGCHKRKVHTKHGLSGHPLYKVWEGIVNRCYAKNSPAFRWYGARGISMCDEWRYNPETFINWAISKNWVNGLTVDREDVNGNYTPHNCRLVTHQTQMNNTTRSCKFEMNGQVKTISEWAMEYGLHRSTLRYRLKVGMKIEDAVL